MKVALRLSIILFLLTCIQIISGQQISLSQKNRSGIYKKGEKIIVYVFPGEKSGDTVHIRVLKNNSQLIEKKSVHTGSDSIMIFKGSFNDPCSVIIEAKANDLSSSIGLMVDPQDLKPGGKYPEDFNSYWDNLKKELRALPFSVMSAKVPVTAADKGYICVNTEINCPGPRPARGYFAKPEKAAPGTLPIVLLVHAAGVKGSWCRSEPQNALNYAKKGALCFDLNAHGMLNGQPESYYADLEEGELKNYSLQGITVRDEVYFRAMYLRMLRTIDFLTTQPEWDGKRILVIGESQGGGQALAAAGLDTRVSAVVAIVPAMCDWLAPLVDRMGGWPHPFESGASKEQMLKALPYFDNANILKNSKAIIFVEIGLIDMTCPSTSVYTAINQAKSRKIIYTVPYRPHHQPDNYLTRLWQETVYKPRELFINNYLK